MDFYACMSSPANTNYTNHTNCSTTHTDPTAHSTLREQYETLKRHCASLTETVQVLGDQSSQTTVVAQKSKLQEQLQQMHSSKLELSQRHSDLQEQFNKLKVTSQTLSQNCKAADEKLFLQNQLHADKLRLVEVTQNTLKDRCKAMSVSAEQHRIANLRLEERHKSISKDLEQLVELHGSGIQSIASAKDRVIQTLQCTIQAERARCNKGGMRLHPCSPGLAHMQGISRH